MRYQKYFLEVFTNYGFLIKHLNDVLFHFTYQGTVFAEKSKIYSENREEPQEDRVQGGARGRGQPRGRGRPRGCGRPRVARNIQPRGCGRGQGRPRFETADVIGSETGIISSAEASQTEDDNDVQDVDEIAVEHNAGAIGSVAAIILWQRVVKEGEEKIEEGREEKTLVEAAVGVAVVGAGVIGQDEVFLYHLQGKKSLNM